MRADDGELAVRVLVAGGTGFIGRAVLAELRRAAHRSGGDLEVLVLSRRGLGVTTGDVGAVDDGGVDDGAAGAGAVDDGGVDDGERQRSAIDGIEGDWSVASSDWRILDFAPQVVINLIGDSHPRSSIGLEAEEIRHQVLPFLELIEVLEPRGLERVIFSSSAGSIYRSGTDAVAKGRSDSAYHSTKRSIEHYLSSRSAATGLQAVSLRISNPVGDLDRPGFGVVGHFARAVAGGHEANFIGDADLPKDYVVLEDVAVAVASLVVRPWSGVGHEVVDVGSGWSIDARGMYKLIHSLAAAGPETPPPEIGRSPLDHGFTPSALDLTSLRRLTGWRPRHDLVASIERIQRRAARAP